MIALNLPLLALPKNLGTLTQNKASKALKFPAVSGSLDALLLAHAAHQKNAVFCESASTAFRLFEELKWLLPAAKIALFPDLETLPYDHFSAHHDVISERLLTLYKLQTGAVDILLIPASTAAHFLPPKSFLLAHTFFLKTGQKIDLNLLRAQLVSAAYSNVTQVITPGEYAIRGGLIDIFPMGTAEPFRLDLLDDEIESIKMFDVDSQRTTETVEEIRLLPAREFPMDEAGRTQFRQNFRTRFEGDPARTHIYKDISNGIASAGIEYWLPLFFDENTEKPATIFDYLNVDTRLCFVHDVPKALLAFWQQAKSRYDLGNADKNRPLLKPEELFLSDEAFFIAAKNYAHLTIPAALVEKAVGKTQEQSQRIGHLPEVFVERRAENPLQRFADFIRDFDGKILLSSESAGRRETIFSYLKEYGIIAKLAPDLSAALEAKINPEEKLQLIVSPLYEGFMSDKIALITEAELYADSAKRSRKSLRDKAKKASLENWLRDLSELKIGDPVVHEDHGIARYQGLVHLDLGEGKTEFLELHYLGDTKLYVPVTQLHVISRYSGMNPDEVHLHALGRDTWEKAKKKAALQARDTAAELLALYAERAARKGHSFEFSTHDYEAFADDFGFEETVDQAAAINAVIDDMRSGKPMDRLVCGDVGFGKTEVALRAAFCAVAGGKQVAILCPTTLLCEQHFQTFSDRFSNLPVKVAQLSRFNTGKETTNAIKELADGRADIAIGTHKLLQKSIAFARLGLVIIDEEHRFGVRQKETLKALRAEVDVLTLTATPIPRTLGLSLEGLRDFSVIATAPQKRLAIKTFVAPFSDGIIREALLREFSRGGQVYFLHNEVSTIDNMHEKLAKLVPEARIAIGHGQMNERELERVMRDFTARRTNLLLCTTIIETGIDNPHANTILMNRADKFGLAQLHQLRGRVGRSHHQAYAYLLTPSAAELESGLGLSKQAKQRLEAICRMEELGSGFYLAMHDLEIRGAGEILGDNQSGEMQEVGFTLYNDMLSRAVAALKEGKEPDILSPLSIQTEVNLHVPALLPSDYAPDVHERLTLYKRIANGDSSEALTDLQEELIDRFGQLPIQAEALMESHRLRLAAKVLGITKVDVSMRQITLNFVKNPPINPMKIIELIQKNRNYKLAGQDKLIVLVDLPLLFERVAAVKMLFKQIAG